MKHNKDVKWWSSPRTLLRTILMLDDTSHSIAMGTTVGMFIGMTPTVGIQMILVIIFAFLVSPLLKFNRMAALVTVYFSNPITVVPIYWFNYKVGGIFVEGTVSQDVFTNILKYDGLNEWWGAFVTLFVEVGSPLVLGSLIVATVCSALTYPAMRYILHRMRDSQPPEPQPTKTTEEAEEPVTSGVESNP